LENKSPGNQRKEEQKSEDGARYPAGLRKNVKNVADETGEEKNNVSPSESLI
jgi:hypothetical protein